MVVLRQDALECGACLAPLLVPAVVAGAVEGPVLGIGAEGLLRARVGDDGVLDAEPGQAEASLALRQVEPRGKRGGLITFWPTGLRERVIRRDLVILFFLLLLLFTEKKNIVELGTNKLPI